MLDALTKLATRVASQDPTLISAIALLGGAAAPSPYTLGQGKQLMCAGRTPIEAVAWAAVRQAGYKTGSVEKHHL